LSYLSGQLAQHRSGWPNGRSTRGATTISSHYRARTTAPDFELPRPIRRVGRSSSQTSAGNRGRATSIQGVYALCTNTGLAAWRVPVDYSASSTSVSGISPDLPRCEGQEVRHEQVSPFKLPLVWPTPTILSPRMYGVWVRKSNLGESSHIHGDPRALPVRGCEQRVGNVVLVAPQREFRGHARRVRRWWALELGGGSAGRYRVPAHLGGDEFRMGAARRLAFRQLERGGFVLLRKPTEA